MESFMFTESNSLFFCIGLETYSLNKHKSNFRLLCVISVIMQFKHKNEAAKMNAWQKV